MASYLIDVCRFNPTAGGTTDWTYSSAVTGCQGPAAAGAVNGLTYSYRAESADQSQWEMGTGPYDSGTGTFARTTVLYNSSGTTSKINFSTAPQVAIVALAEDIVRGQTGHIPGIASNTAASAGEVGEVIPASGTSGTLTSGVTTAIGSIPLTAGDLDVSATVQFNTGGATSTTDYYVSLSATSASIAAPYGTSLVLHERGPAAADHSAAFTIMPTQALLNSATTLYLNVQAVYTGTATTATWSIRARRMR